MLTSLLNVSTIYIIEVRIISDSTDEISDKDMRKTVDLIQDTFLKTQENNKNTYERNISKIKANFQNKKKLGENNYDS